MTTKNKKRMSVLVITGLLLAGLMVPVFAADDASPELGPEPQINSDGVRHFFSGVLARTFRYQVSMTEFIGNSLDSAEGTVERAGLRISELEEQGKDVSMLEEAIAEFDDLLNDAQNDYSAAQGIVDLHSGFDDDGFVEDLDEAHKTIKAIEPYIASARENIVEAVRTVYEAIQEYQEANPE